MARVDAVRTQDAMPAGDVCRSSGVGADLNELAVPLEHVLASGGDPRLYVDPIDMLNGYGCRPWPRPEALTFASSTATSISDRAFAAAEEARQDLLRSSHEMGLDNALDRHAERLRGRIRAILQLDPSRVEIVFSPSGTDSQIIALYVAQSVLAGSLVSVIVASDETGSGTVDTAIGRHFSSRTACDVAVLKGQQIAGVGNNVASVAIPLRTKDGVPRSNTVIDQEVIGVVSRSIAAGKRVVLHVMDSSKFGWRGPSVVCLRHIQAHWARSVQVVVDACQFRLSRKRLHYYLSQGFVVSITGSKFFTGPPLSGALLIPAAVSALMAKIDTVPEGLQPYTNRNDWPIHWGGVRARLSTRPNIGQLLRWAAAVEEMRAYFAVPLSYRVIALQTFASRVSRLFAERSGVQLLSAYDRSCANEIDDEEMAARTIFPFFIRWHGKPLSVEACSLVYRALNRDVSSLLPGSATEQQRQVMARRCHIGQPVGILDPVEGIVGTLRISSGARVISETWCADGDVASLLKLDQEFDSIHTILDKIDLLVDNLDALGEIAQVRGIATAREIDLSRSGSKSAERLSLRSLPPSRLVEAVDAPVAQHSQPHDSYSHGDRN